MNIFFLDENPKLAAQYQCNKHVVKMILESAQLLCACHHVVGTQSLPDKFYRKTHVNHPCAIWARQHINNYMWLAEHALYLCEEYSYRYNKIHASQNLIEWLCINEPNINSSKVNRFKLGEYYVTEPPQCMPDEFKADSPIKAYRSYYGLCKRNTIECKWTKRAEPNWW